MRSDEESRAKRHAGFLLNRALPFHSSQPRPFEPSHASHAQNPRPYISLSLSVVIVLPIIVGGSRCARFRGRRNVWLILVRAVVHLTG